MGPFSTVGVGGYVGLVLTFSSSQIRKLIEFNMLSALRHIVIIRSQIYFRFIGS